MRSKDKLHRFKHHPEEKTDFLSQQLVISAHGHDIYSEQNKLRIEEENKELRKQCQLQGEKLMQMKQTAESLIDNINKEHSCQCACEHQPKQVFEKMACDCSDASRARMDSVLAEQVCYILAMCCHGRNLSRW